MESKYVLAWLGILAVVAGFAVWLGIGGSNYKENRDNSKMYNFELYPAGADRFDCYPEPDGTEEACVNRGCVWGEPEIPEAPWCYYPQGHGYRMVSILSCLFSYIVTISLLYTVYIGVRGGGCGAAAPPPPPRIFSNSHFQAKKACNIRAKPLDFRASNGENISGNWSQPP